MLLFHFIDGELEASGGRGPVSHGHDRLRSADVTPSTRSIRSEVISFTTQVLPKGTKSGCDFLRSLVSSTGLEISLCLTRPGASEFSLMLRHHTPDPGMGVASREEVASSGDSYARSSEDAWSAIMQWGGAELEKREPLPGLSDDLCQHHLRMQLPVSSSIHRSNGSPRR